MSLRLPSMTLKTKLTLAVSALLVLTTLVGTAGIILLERYRQHTEILMSANSMEVALLEARNSEKDFLRLNTRQDLEAAVASSKAAQHTASELTGILTSSEDRTRLATIQRSAEQYARQLVALADAQQARQQATESLENSARIAASRLSTEVQLYMVENSLKRMRAHERSFLLQNDTDAIEPFKRLGSQAREAIESSFASQSVKEETLALIGAYISSFDAAVESTQALTTVNDQLSETAHTVVSSAEALRERLNAGMLDYQSQAILLIASVIVISIALGVLTALTLARSILRPLREAVAIARKVADGHLDEEVSVHRQDEFGQLQQAMGTMVRNLRDLIRNIGDGSRHIGSSTDHLSRVMTETSDGMNQQRDQTDQVATAMEEMVAATNEVARSAEEASEAGTVATKKADAGVRAVEGTLTKVTELNTAVLNAQERLDGLRSETQNIETILDVIKSVAEQTNLLALNAAIEAARAGEQGRGFAVVADEVRSLAQRTQTSAQEIESLIANLLGSVDQTVSVMNTGTGLTSLTLESAQSTGETIGELSQTITTITQLNYQIATAAEEQTSVAEDINRNITFIRDVTERTAGLTNEASTASNDLVAQGETLRQQVTRFHL